MRRPHLLLLHALLSLALVANGIGAAMASAHAGCIHSAAAVAKPVTDAKPVAESAVAEPPCHGDMAPQTSASMHDGAHRGMAGDASVADEVSGGSDCDSACEIACDCACTAHGQAALMPPTLLLRASARIAHAAMPVHERTAPTLPHPVRPPIG